VGFGQAFLARQSGLPARELALALLELLGSLLQVGAEAHVALGVCELGLEPVQLGLARRQLDLAPVEVCRALRRLADDGGLVGVVALERLEVAAEPLLLEQQFGLALAEGLVLGRDARGLLLEIGLARREFALALGDFLVARAALVLALRERPLAAFELDNAGALSRLELLFGPGELLLAVGQRLPRLLELVGNLGAVPIEALQLAQLRLGLLVTLGRELLLSCELRLELGQPGMLGLDRLALVMDLALPRLELGRELGELRVPLVEGGSAAGQSLLGLGAGLEHFLLLREGRLQLISRSQSRVELPAEVLGSPVGDDGERLVVTGPCRQLEAQLDVRLVLGGRGSLRLIAPALELCAEAGAELFLLGLVAVFGRHFVCS
jgi:hypothetical protein